MSPWIEGTHIVEFTREILESLFNTLYYIEIAGLFEYDLSLGNILLQKDGTVRLFDFGYMYPYNPLKEYNADGRELPLFHGAERFESRCFMQYLMNIEDALGKDKVLQEYRIEKEVAIKYYNKKLRWLQENNGDKEIIQWTDGLIHLWEKSLKSQADLELLYHLESFRSYILDIHDDISGKSCTIYTLKKVDKILDLIATNYCFLKENNGLLWDDQELNQEQLLEKYKANKEIIKEYQIE